MNRSFALASFDVVGVLAICTAPSVGAVIVLYGSALGLGPDGAKEFIEPSIPFTFHQFDASILH